MGEQNSIAENKIVVGVLGIILGGIGVHRFLLGDVKGGVIRIVITFFTAGIGGVIGFIEGIIYLTKSDEEYIETYVKQKKAWF